MHRVIPIQLEKFMKTPGIIPLPVGQPRAFLFKDSSRSNWNALYQLKDRQGYAEKSQMFHGRKHRGCEDSFPVFLCVLRAAVNCSSDNPPCALDTTLTCSPHLHLCLDRI